ncbi:MAG: arsenate reductase (glutaredoxin) [Salinivirgaceae bacterium]|jgi:arsenate reductase|nr:arsenate reductase (glutaredoxin) [Salinivirgaceae bacterium]
MLTIYHNPQCKKSREGLTYLENKTSDFEMVKYLNNTFSEDKLAELLEKMKKKPNDIIRKQEDYYKKELKSKDLTDNELIQAMVSHPKLIGRPIVETDTKAVLAIPPEEIEKLFK